MQVQSDTPNTTLLEAQAMAERNELLPEDFFIDHTGEVQFKPARSQTTVRLDTSDGELKMLRDVVIRAHQMTGGNYVQSAEVMRDRAYRLLDAAIDASPVMRGFLGRGGPCADRDILTGSGDLS